MKYCNLFPALASFWDRLHFLSGNKLVVSTDATDLMQGIRQLCMSVDVMLLIGRPFEIVR